MITLILLIVIICFCVSAVAMFRKPRYVATTILALLLVSGSLWLIAKNDNEHLGMKQASTQTTTQLQSSYKSPLPFLVYKQLGTTAKMQERVYSYRLAGQNQRHQTKLQHFSIKVVREKGSSNHAQLVKTVKHYQFKSTGWHLLFLGTQADRTTTTTYVFKVPANWLVLESKQAKKLPKAARQLQGQATRLATQAVTTRVKQEVSQQVKAQAPAAVSAQVKERVSTDPAIMQDAAQLAALKQQVTAQVTASLTKKVTASVERKDLPRIKRQERAQAKAQVVKVLRSELE